MEGVWKRAIPEHEIIRLADDIDRQGYGTIGNFVSDEELAEIRAFAEAKVRDAGGEYVGLVGRDAVGGTLLNQLSRSPEFANLCQRLFELCTGEQAPATDFVQVLRCLQGPTGQYHSNRFHYDSYVLTVIIAVAIPEIGKQGDLVILNNPRPIRRSYLLNLFDKLLIDNPLSQWAFCTASRHNLPGIVKIRVRPGSAYFIWGYRSIHTNEPVDQDKLRATAIFHYGDPHRHSGSRKLIRTLRAQVGSSAPPGY